MKIAICDDNIEHLEIIKRMISNTFTIDYKEVTEYERSEKLIDDASHTEYELAIIDIELTDTNGIELAKQLREILPNINFIFISGEPSYWEEVYNVEHIYFLRKPIDNVKFEEALIKANERIKKNYITILSKGNIAKININDICIVENTLRSVKIYTKDGVKGFNHKIDEIGMMLPKCKFVRCHKSFLINMDKIKEVNKNLISIVGCSDGEIHVSISKRYIASFKDTLTKYLGDSII